MDLMKGLLLFGVLAVFSLTGVTATGVAPQDDEGNAGMDPGDMYQCYNFSCTSPELDCLTKSILHHLVDVPSCSGEGQYCKITRATMDGMHTVVSECSKEECEYTETYCPINGDVVYNCCNTHYCNTELILGSLPDTSAASSAAAAPLALLPAAAFLGFRML